MQYKQLEQHIIDLVKEQQAKLGYRKETIRLYYPLKSLQNILGNDMDAAHMLETLNNFSHHVSDTLGELGVTCSEGQFCICISEQGSEWVHEQSDDTEFIVSLIAFLSQPDCTMQGIIQLFQQQEHPVHIREMTNNEFDYRIYFEGAEDRYFYCFKDEGHHIIYHRFLPEDYRDFGFE